MLRECVEVCPEDVWVAGEHPRNFWRIAYHAIFFAHLYAMQGEEDFVSWSKHREDADCLWENPPVVDPYTQKEILQYIDEVDGQIEGWIDALDLISLDSGFSWYPNFAKLDHVMLSIRHLQGHIGQLSELLMAHGIDTKWVSKG